jgi:hypothetical protein
LNYWVLVCVSCIGTIKTNENENPPEFLSQEFVVAQGIIMEDCIPGLDALYEYKFVIDGFEKRVYRVREPYQFNNCDKVRTRESRMRLGSVYWIQPVLYDEQTETERD